MILARGVGALICLSAFALSWHVAFQTFDTLWIRSLAADLEADEIENDRLPTEDLNWQAVSDTTACDTETLYSGLVVMLRKLDQVRPAGGDFTEWAAGMAGGERFLTHMTHCLPTDGNAWLRLAMVQRAIAEAPTSLCALIEKSRAFAPNEALVMSARLRFYGRLNEMTVERCDRAIRKDIRTVLVQGRKTDFERTVAGFNPQLLALASDELSRLDETSRRLAIRQYKNLQPAKSR